MIGKGTLRCLGATEKYIEFIILSWCDRKVHRVHYFVLVRQKSTSSSLFCLGATEKYIEFIILCCIIPRWTCERIDSFSDGKGGTP